MGQTNEGEKVMGETVEGFHKAWVEAGRPIDAPWSERFVNANCISFKCQSCPMKEYCDKLVSCFRELRARAPSQVVEHVFSQVQTETVG